MIFEFYFQAKYDGELLKLHQNLIQFQHENKQYVSQIERYQLNIEKLQNEINEKQTVSLISLTFVRFSLFEFSLSNKFKLI